MPEDTTPIKRPLISNSVYDVLKFVALVVLPAVATLYFALATLWDLPNPDKVVGTITAVDAFLGALLGLLTKNYNASDAKYDGAIEIEQPATPGGPKVFSLVLNTNPEALEGKGDVTFKVQPK